jgi:hypothetical protein
MTTRPGNRPRIQFPVAEVVITVALATLFGAAMLESMEWSARAALFPRMVTGLGLALALAHLVLLLVRSFAHRSISTAEHMHDGKEEAVDDDLEYVFATVGRTAWSRAIAWLAAFFVSLYVLGLLVTAPLFAVVYLRFSARASWALSLVYAAVTAAVLYGLFELALEMPVPPGLL